MKIAFTLALGAITIGLTLPCAAQTPVYTLGGDGDWATTETPTPGSNEAEIAEARRLIAIGEFKEAERLMDTFIDRFELTDSPWLPHAYLLRGDARLGRGNEYRALFDYEAIVQNFPDAPVFVDAIERELDIASRYVNGLKRKFLGLRIESSRLLGEELLVRVQERMPSSGIAEEAAITLADHYYERRDMRLAAEMYGIFVENYPESEHATRARVNEIFSNVARFKGPAYDASSLVEAGELIDDFQRRFPAEAERAGVTVGLASRIDESAAQQMLDRARWYFRQKDEPSARFTLERLLRRHPRSTAAQIAIRTLEERGWLDDAETLDDAVGDPTDPIDTTEEPAQ
ncbi:MAG: hypothetical protein CMJ31_03060 [Phycisphaerae bacterium]|nr:hypothetical protein [Phycisphaerae bacterium]